MLVNIDYMGSRVEIVILLLNIVLSLKSQHTVHILMTRATLLGLNYQNAFLWVSVQIYCQDKRGAFFNVGTWALINKMYNLPRLRRR